LRYFDIIWLIVTDLGEKVSSVTRMIVVLVELVMATSGLNVLYRRAAKEEKKQ
jgi:hypothetical protein